MNQVEVCNKESFKIRGKGVIVLLKHDELGLETPVFFVDND